MGRQAVERYPASIHSHSIVTWITPVHHFSLSSDIIIVIPSSHEVPSQLKFISRRAAYLVGQQHRVVDQFQAVIFISVTAQARLLAYGHVGGSDHDYNPFRWLMNTSSTDSLPQ